MEAELTLYKKDEMAGGYFIPDYSYFVDKNNDFELIEEDTIDIDSIEEFKIDENNFIQTELGAFKTRKMDIAFLNKINSIIRWAKQADKEIKEVKEK